MVKLERPAAPTQLTPAFVVAQTAKYKADGSSVWNIDWLKKALIGMSHGKCAYCESGVAAGGAYMEVEHFVSKDQDKDQVLKWENLLPACKRCNGNKQAHDVLAEPIVNPVVEDPTGELKMVDYRLIGKNAKGRMSIDVLDLNETARLALKRFEIGDALHHTIDVALGWLKQHKENPLPVRRTKLTGVVRKLLKQCQPDSSYAATCATTLHSSEDYVTVKQYLVANSFWDAELDAIDKASFKIRLV